MAAKKANRERHAPRPEKPLPEGDGRERMTLIWCVHGLALLTLGGILGTLTELLLLRHTGAWQQLIPIVLLSASALCTLWCYLRPRRTNLFILRAVLVLLVVGGLIGLYLHYENNHEYELEMDPAIQGWALFYSTITGALPALAPGFLVYLGVLGWMFAWVVERCHLQPVLAAVTPSENP